MTPPKSNNAGGHTAAILTGQDATKYTGHALSLSFHNPDLGPVATILFQRRGRVPATLVRKVLLDENGCGRFYGWGPGKLNGIALQTDGSVEPAQLKLLVALNTVPLWKIAFLVARKSPLAVGQIIKLLLARNIRGVRYRFGRLYESLNEPSYENWLKRRNQAAFNLGSETGLKPRVFVSVIGNDAREATLQSIERQSYRDIEARDPSQIEMPLKDKGEAFWLRLPAGVCLHEKAVEAMLQPLLDNPDIAGIYCDEDMMDADGGRDAPFFKPAWNAPLAETGWLAPDGAIIRVSALQKEIDLEQSTSGQLLLEASKRGRIAHIPRVMLHRLSPLTPALPSRPKVASARTKVSVIIPTRDRADLLSACLDGLLKRTRFDELDVIVIDNESAEPETHALFAKYEGQGLVNRVPLPGSFNFSRACNLGVAHARHDLVLLLNNDVEPINPEWLDQMVAELDDDDIGAVGALLLFPDGYVQHAGVTLGSGSVARHSFQFRKPGERGDWGLIEQRQEMSAVTGACLLTRRSLWHAVGGMNEERLTVAFNDVDYCLKLREIGKGIMWTPHARLIHHESVSRGRDDTPAKLERFAKEEAYMHERWGEVLQNDPFYNPNLSLIVGDRCLDVEPRDLSPRFARAKARNFNEQDQGGTTSTGRDKSQGEEEHHALF
ncbi:glycosyltransferase family 2 protein [Neorhizobium lilium]|uniref:glycosyltransferase family 2 protein n=1 Tax=Neorhizobium lilium TaxID=2503024 RepID=UPI0013E2EDBA|nr:glycosyltransferase family 2 protein [Neorhizobium lilium]